MRKNVIVRYVEKKLQNVYKGRKISLKKEGLIWKLVAHDVLDNLQFSLSGVYSYEEVVRLNEITGYTARFGICPRLGPVAFIGIPNPNFDFSFFREVNCKKRRINKEELKFKKCEQDFEKLIGHYRVFGLCGLDKLKDIVEVEEVRKS